MNKPIENYLAKNYTELRKITKRITKNHDLSDDLLHEVIIQLYDKKIIKLKKYDDNSIRYYIVAIIRTNWFSKTSPFYYKVRREIDRYSPFDGINDPMDQSQYDFEINQILDIIELEYVELDWFEKSLMDMYLTLGSLSKVSKKTTIPLTSVSNYIRQIRTNLKERIINQLNQQ